MMSFLNQDSLYARSSLSSMQSKANVDKGDSIVSQADEHFSTQNINIKHDHSHFAPKSTSSTTSLFELIRKQAIKCTKKCKINSTKTPLTRDKFNQHLRGKSLKKQLQRCSTPKTLHEKKYSIRDYFIKKSKACRTPFSSTTMSQYSCNFCPIGSSKKVQFNGMEEILNGPIQNHKFLLGDLNVWII